MTTQSYLEYIVAEAWATEHERYWVICPCTAQALGPFHDWEIARYLADVLNQAQLPRALREASRYDS